MHGGVYLQRGVSRETGETVNLGPALNIYHLSGSHGNRSIYEKPLSHKGEAWCLFRPYMGVFWLRSKVRSGSAIFLLFFLYRELVPSSQAFERWQLLSTKDFFLCFFFGATPSKTCIFCLPTLGEGKPSSRRAAESLFPILPLLPPEPANSILCVCVFSLRSGGGREILASP